MLKVGDKIKILYDRDDGFCQSMNEGEIYKVKWIKTRPFMITLVDTEGYERYIESGDSFVEGIDYEVIND